MSMFEVLEDPHKGRKVCAVNAMKEGTILCNFTGRIIDYSDTLELGSKESFALQVEKKLYRLLDEPYCYFNHACEPNCGLSPGLELITLRPVQKHEELRYDYSTTMLEHHWTMACKCNAAHCRKVIGDFDKLPRRLQQKYIALNVVQQFIIEALHGA